MDHTTECAWSQADCEYKATHFYCPHPEHACTCKPAEPVETDWLTEPVRITSDSVHFGDVKVPGIIEDGSIAFKPGVMGGFNTLTVTFLVGEVHADPAAEVPF